jgi:glycosyltransferase involved in cell wall biosynthesis
MKNSLALIIPAFNAAPYIKYTVQSALSQVLPPDFSLSVIVVDDGSTDDTADIVTGEFGDRIVLIRSEENHGRSLTRNLGASNSDAGILCFLDADCLYRGTSCLANHITALEAADVSIGALQTKAGGFWSTYQQHVFEKRAHQHPDRDIIHYTTANTAIRSDVFRSIGGFDSAYAHYGFEDRDFYLRVMESGASIAAISGCVAYHDAELSLHEACRKLEIAGHHTSGIFAERFPEAYAEMNYSKIDVRIRGWPIRLLDLFFSPALPAAVRGWDRLLEHPALPYRVKSLGVKLLFALSFMHGCILAEADKKKPPVTP